MISRYSSPEQVASELDFDDTSAAERIRLRRFLWSMLGLVLIGAGLGVAMFAIPG